VARRPPFIDDERRKKMLALRRPLGRTLQPFDRDLLEDMNRIVNEMRTWWEGEGEFTTWSPPVNVYGVEDRIVVEAELPGLKKDEIEVSVHEHTLTLSGEREDEKIKEQDYFRHERASGSFLRSITLPTTVDADKIDAKYENGVLMLSIPKVEEAKAKKIAIH
jgi:HSP20 family protein